MGRYNSSITRVKPLGDAIRSNHDILKRMLSIVAPNVPSVFGDFEEKNVYYTGWQGEKALPATPEHLKAIIKKIVNDEAFRKYVQERDNSTKSNKDKRQLLFNLDQSMIEQASTSKFVQWNTFEGSSKPDLFIENDKFIILIEGKRTESDTTDKVSYLKHRSQMVRHIENALHHCNNAKQVIAFYVVEENCGYENHCVKEYIEKEIDAETIEKSHALKKAILDSFYGYTTWEKLSVAHGINFPDMANE